MKIDFHTHAFPDTLAPKAIPKLAEAARLTPFHNGTVSGLIHSMNQNGIDRSVVLSIATKPTQEAAVNTFAISLLENDRLIPFGSVYPGSPTFEAELYRLKNAGIKGIKLHPEYQNFYIDSPEALSVYRLCGLLGLVVLLHAGEDAAFDPPVHSGAERINRICELCPETTFVAAHFGGYNMWDDAVKNLSFHENLYLDTSMTQTARQISKDTAKQLVEKMSVSHILLGSDSPWEKPVDSVKGVLALELAASETDNIFCENAKKLLHLS